ncbi:MAG: hypothetical protein COT17_08450 [Elusimicrobia bacterium CG08_land_8_20_14_0_20_51_18]|nr:MAG: hypothetical protein COT17_08450 [Elusimicrobia bacterium CG08_land_8_20_14_0_20_51_18]
MTLTGNYRRLERIIKGVSNHRRIQILELLGRQPELSVNEISERTGSDFKNISAHVRRMAIAGLVMKRSDGKSVRHKITNRGINVLTFVRMLE